MGAFSLGYLGLVSAFVTIYAWLKLHFLEKMGWNVWALLLTIAIYAAGLLLTLLLEPAPKDEFTVGLDDNGGLYPALSALLKRGIERAEYREVIRFGDALSRPLFESGEFRVRLEVGRATEEAAAHLGAIDVQYRNLIDTIGWSLIELGEFIQAKSAIEHGKELAEQAGDWFYQAKASRHLGAIERRRGQNDAATAYYEAAQVEAASIPDDDLRMAMTAGITYATAHLKYSMREFDAAAALIDQAISEFAELDDIYRVDMARVLKADTQVALKQLARAKDTYRSVIQSSRTNRESVHYYRAVLGLSEVYLEQGNSAEAKRLLEALDSDRIADLPAFASRFEASKKAAGCASS